MSPSRRHGGGRPRSENSVLNLAERWGISEKSARRLAARDLPEEAMAILVAECKRYRAAQINHVGAHRKHSSSLRALGMKSRVPAQRCVANSQPDREAEAAVWEETSSAGLGTPESGM